MADVNIQKNTRLWYLVSILIVIILIGIVVFWPVNVQKTNNVNNIRKEIGVPSVIQDELDNGGPEEITDSQNATNTPTAMPSKK